MFMSVMNRIALTAIFGHGVWVKRQFKYRRNYRPIRTTRCEPDDDSVMWLFVLLILSITFWVHIIWPGIQLIAGLFFPGLRQ